MTNQLWVWNNTDTVSQIEHKIALMTSMVSCTVQKQTNKQRNKPSVKEPREETYGCLALHLYAKTVFLAQFSLWGFFFGLQTNRKRLQRKRVRAKGQASWKSGGGGDGVHVPAFTSNCYHDYHGRGKGWSVLCGGRVGVRVRDEDAAVLESSNVWMIGGTIG